MYVIVEIYTPKSETCLNGLEPQHNEQRTTNEHPHMR